MSYFPVPYAHSLIHALKLQLITFAFKMYQIYVISEDTMNPFSKPCIWLVLNHYGTPIMIVYIQTLLDWFG